MTWKGKILYFALGFWCRRTPKQQGKVLDMLWRGQVVTRLGGLGAMLADVSGAKGI